jgi:hypothetical protein
MLNKSSHRTRLIAICPEIASWQRDASVAGAAMATKLWAEAVVLRPRTIHSFDYLDRCFSPDLDSSRHREFSGQTETLKWCFVK